VRCCKVNCSRLPRRDATRMAYTNVPSADFIGGGPDRTLLRPFLSQPRSERTPAGALYFLNFASLTSRLAFGVYRIGRSAKLVASGAGRQAPDHPFQSLPARRWPRPQARAIRLFAPPFLDRTARMRLAGITDLRRKRSATTFY